MLPTHRTRALLFVLIVLILPGVVLAQGGYPLRHDQYVNDFAVVMSAQDTYTIQRQLMDFKRDTGIEVVVVTVRSISSYATSDASFESFATNLFNTWGIGDATRNDGAMILLSVEDRAVRIELGAGYGPELDAKMQIIIDRFMMDDLRGGNYSKGILHGVERLVQTLNFDPTPTPDPNASATPTVAPTATPPVTPFVVPATFGPADDEADGGSGMSPIVVGLGVLGVLATGTAGAIGAGRFWRNRPRNCQECGRQMTRLSEADEDVYLESGQQLEELINSVHYDVWRCNWCDHVMLRRYRQWRSPYRNCSKCNHRTVRVVNTRSTPATTLTTGSRTFTYECRNCKQSYEEQLVVPRLREVTPVSSSRRSWGSSSRSSRSSHRSNRRSGGGRSSGGGASGRW